jgi:hypothetical protein
VALQLNSSTPSAYSGGSFQAVFIPTATYPH